MPVPSARANRSGWSISEMSSPVPTRCAAGQLVAQHSEVSLGVVELEQRAQAQEVHPALTKRGPDLHQPLVVLQVATLGLGAEPLRVLEGGVVVVEERRVVTPDEDHVPGTEVRGEVGAGLRDRRPLVEPVVGRAAHPVEVAAGVARLLERLGVLPAVGVERVEVLVGMSELLGREHELRLLRLRDPGDLGSGCRVGQELGHVKVRPDRQRVLHRRDLPREVQADRDAIGPE